MIGQHPFMAHAAMFHHLMGVFLLFGLVLQVVCVVIPAFMILRRMGFSGWWSLISFVPLGKTVGLWVLATSPWPVERGGGPGA